jgi:DNA-directed RNA polymerase I subunit RPA2
MLTAEVAQPSNSDVVYPFKKMNIWFENFELKTPEKAGSATDANKMMPYECRLRSLSY